VLVVGWAATASALAYLAGSNARRANANAAEALRNEERANALAARALASERQAKKNAETAKRLHQHAVGQMIQLVEQVQNRLRDRRLSRSMGAQGRALRQDLLNLLRERALLLAREVEGDRISSFGLAAMHQRLGDLFRNLGQGEEALRQYRQAVRRIEKVVAAQPDNDVARANLGVMLLRLGELACDRDADPHAALASFRRARQLQQEIFTRPRSGEYTEAKNKILLARADVHLGRAYLQGGDPAAAARHFRQALAYRKEWAAAPPHSAEARSYLAEVYLWLGVTAWHQGDAGAVAENFRQALRLGEELAAQHPRDVSFKADLADLYGNFGDAQVRLGQPEAASKSYRRSAENLQKVLTLRPGVPAYDSLLALTQERLAADALRQGRRPEAARRYQEALQLRADLAELEPSNRVQRAAYLLALARCGKHAEAGRGALALRKEASDRPELLVQVARCYVACAGGVRGEEAEGYRAQALDALNALAAVPGYRDAVALRTDPDLAPLRKESAFRALLSKLGAGGR
jgi:tetratricopeptide (TPR) repeat protein